MDMTAAALIVDAGAMADKVLSYRPKDKAKKLRKKARKQKRKKARK